MQGQALFPIQRHIFVSGRTNLQLDRSQFKQGNKKPYLKFVTKIRCESESQGAQEPKISKPLTAPQKRLSFNQQWVSFRNKVREGQRKSYETIMKSQFMKFILLYYTKLSDFTKPGRQQTRKWYRDFKEDYSAFTMAEVKRQWKFRNHTELEKEYWIAVLLALRDIFLTMVWEAFVPVSWFWAVILPLVTAWIVYDHWYFSPITVGLLIMWPMKFVQGRQVPLF
eukprot:TRINITY_DN17640_c1_g1_i1.p1 TRINITY_DN17640_c1_g1~~TRINITY_DN17640_c1_g1_i1.p1  ORF type:complete len:224 (+),score=9.47 TRINITY_DN17640_c1_g1_i1:42-713(+)